ncbi:MAG: sigma-70 family RNA polymerase sigma factor [Sandaracinus sp.]|nr:sigma-70 family RNA polymerase sigma factor [Sandaracinus sp.]MCB9634474.1 sigma-70 family RNA polymerase sigma factor [Sandaracinus sp.]
MPDLGHSFLRGLAGAYELDGPTVLAVGPTLEAHLARARARWPRVALSGDEFAEHLARCAPDADELANALGGLCTDDVFLACACARGDRAAIEAFEAEVMPHVPRAIVRIDRDETFVREVMEEVRIKLLVGDGREPRIASYLGRGPLTSWVQVTAIRTGYSFKRKRNPETPVADEDAFDLPIDDDPELARLRERVQEPFRAAFREALASLSPRERTLLRLYLLEEVSAETLGTMYDVHRATIARWITQARRQVHDETRRRLSKTLGLDARAFESLMNRVLSGLDVSLASFLERS